MKLETTYLSRRHEAVSTTDRNFWNDSHPVEAPTCSTTHGAVGAASNPPITSRVQDKERHLWEDRIRRAISEHPIWAEEELTWGIVEEIAVNGPELLLPALELPDCDVG